MSDHGIDHRGEREITPPKMLLRNPELVGKALVVSPAVQALSATIEANAIKDRLAAVLVRLNESLLKKVPEVSVNIAQLALHLNEMTRNILEHPQVPFITKTKFLDDIERKVGILDGVSLASIRFLEGHRMVKSLGCEAIELRHCTRAEKDSFFLQKILAQTLTGYVNGASNGIQRAFVEKQILDSKGISVNQKNEQSVALSIARLDGLYGLNISTEIAKIQHDPRRSSLSREQFFGEIRRTIFKHFATKDPEFARNTTQIRATLETTNMNFGIQNIKAIPKVRIGAGEVSIATILETYRQAIVSYQSTELELTNIRQRSQDTGVLAISRSALGIDALETEFTAIQPREISAKIDAMSLSDTIILATEAIAAFPGLGDMTGGADAIASALNGMSTDGRQMGALNRSLTGILGLLGVTMIGGLFLKGKNALKIAEILESLALVKKVIPGKVIAFLQNAQHIEHTVIERLQTMLKTICGEKLAAPALKRLAEFDNTKGVNMNVLGWSIRGKQVDRASLHPTKFSKLALLVADNQYGVALQQGRQELTRELSLLQIQKANRQFLLSQGGKDTPVSFVGIGSNEKVRVRYLDRQNNPQEVEVNPEELLTAEGVLRYIEDPVTRSSSVKKRQLVTAS